MAFFLGFFFFFFCIRYVICAFFVFLTQQGPQGLNEKRSKQSKDCTSRALDEIDSQYGEWFKGPEEIKLGDLKGGDHIAVKAEMKNLFPHYRALIPQHDGYYFHHGIFVKESRINRKHSQVIDFHGDDKDSARVTERDFLDFLESSCDKKIYRINYKPGKCDSAEVTLDRAYEAVNEGWAGYRITDNNCETFAYKVKTGKNLGSKQADVHLIQAMPSLETAAAVAGVAAGAAAAASAASITYAITK